jgi:ATP-dependent helicase/nuclease subunit B
VSYPLRVWPSDDALEEGLVPETAVATDFVSGGDISWRRFAESLAPPAPALEPTETRLALREACLRAGGGEGRPFLTAAARFIAEAERAGIEPDEAEAAAVELPIVAVFARAFAELRTLTEGRGWSPERRRGAARAVAGEGIAVRLPATIEPADLRLVLALAERRPVRLHLPWDAARPAIFGGLEPVLSACEAARGDLELVLEDPAEGSPAAACLRSLYASGPASPPPAGWLSLLAAPTPDAELRAIAASVRACIDAGVPPEEIAIVVRDPGSVGDRLDEELSRVGLPLGRGAVERLAAAPLYRFVAGLLALPDGGFAREEVLAVLASRYLGAAASRTAARLARGARKVGSRELLAGALPADDVDDLAAVLAKVAALPHEAPLATHAAALARLLVELKVGRYARAYDSSFVAQPEDDLLRETVERALGRDQTAAAALEDVLVRSAQLGLGDRPRALAEWRAVLDDLAAETPLSRPVSRGGVVRLIGAHELAGRRFAHVFLARLVDGVAPARAREDGLYGDRERRALNRALRRWVFPSSQGSEAASGDRTPFESLYLVQALAAGRDGVHASWARSDSERPILRSPFVDELCRVAPAVPIDAPPPAPVPRMPRAPRDLMMRAALEQLADPAGRVPPPPPEVTADLATPLADVVPARWQRIVALSGIERHRLQVFARQAEPDVFAGAVGELPALVRRMGGEPSHPLPARALDLLANCGFQFFAERVLRARPTDEADAAPSRLDLGSIAHRCLELFYRDRAAAGALPLRPADEPANRQALDRACATVFGEEARRPRGSAALWGIAAEKLAADLWRLVAHEAEAGAPGGGVPAWFELSFGSKDAGSLPPLALGPLYISGRIDRIDRAPGGGLVVLDYKLGRVASERHKLSEREAAVTQLQLPVYAAAARAGLAPEATVDAAFISLRDGIATKSLGEVASRQLRTPGIPDALFDRLGARVAELGASVQRGDYRVDPVDCRRCQYRTVCRVVALNEDEDEVGS